MATVAFFMVIFGLFALGENVLFGLVLMAAGFLTYDVDRYMNCQPTKVKIEYSQWFKQTCPDVDKVIVD